MPPGAYQVRAARPRDENSGGIGSAYSFLNLPDFNDSKLTLSSIELSTTTPSPHSDVSSWARFITAAAVAFQCDVFGFRRAPEPPREPHVEMEVRLFRDGETDPVFDSGVLPVAARTLATNYLDGQLRLGRNIEAGDYALQLTVYDRLAPQKKQAATQWANLTVVAPAATP